MVNAFLWPFQSLIFTARLTSSEIAIPWILFRANCPQIRRTSSLRRGVLLPEVIIVQLPESSLMAFSCYFTVELEHTRADMVGLPTLEETP